MKTTNKVKFAQDFLYLTELFHKQNEFKTEFESMEVNKISTFCYVYINGNGKFYVCCDIETRHTMPHSIRH